MNDPFPRRPSPTEESRTAQTMTGTTTSTPKTPIHYEFGVAKDDDDEEQRDANNGPKTASPRQDLITRYMSTRGGKLQVRTSSTLIGGGLGVVLTKVSETRFLHSFD
jgi:hypothetical protein